MFFKFHMNFLEQHIEYFNVIRVFKLNFIVVIICSEPGRSGGEVPCGAGRGVCRLQEIPTDEGHLQSKGDRPQSTGERTTEGDEQAEK